MTNNTMVFGDDGSFAADVAWLWINSHAWPGWRLEVLNAVAPGYVKASASKAEAHEWVPDNPRSAFAETRFDDVVQLTIDEDPRLALMRTADLLVIGHRGRGLAKSMHLGSTAEWLLTHPPAPMVIARHGRRTQSIVICHDGSAHAWAATYAVCRLPWIDHVAATVVGVDEGRGEIAPAIDAAANLVQGAGAADVHSEILTGEATERLVTYVEEHAPDLIAMGTRGLTGLLRLRLGSTAGRLARSTRHSVLLACDDSADEAVAP